MEVGVRVEREDPLTGEIAHTASAYLTFVAIDASGGAVEVPGLDVDLPLRLGHVEMDHAMEDVEIPLLIFFISLFIVVGGVEESGLLRWLGQFIIPFVQEDLLTATLVLMWVAALLSAAIDNIPFTAAMIPILLGMEAQGINVMPLWWALSAGVGLGGNGTHIGSTANVYIVTISERLAKNENDPSLAITPWIWFRYGTPAMLAGLIACSLVFYFFFDFYNNPLPG